MKRVYEAANNIQAHIVMHVLEQAGVHAMVQGEFRRVARGNCRWGIWWAWQSTTRTSRLRARLLRIGKG